ncbi:MAG: histidine phosphatase family protein [Winogradskyella sp.]|nr:histidine phosphatase family protein [Winogradskyella sp.]NNF84952.1 histidine phosphatase family protein [Winogradskyella sp.]NNL82033.1 histidine phosphatase family protein [Winogradskyella sp.]
MLAPLVVQAQESKDEVTTYYLIRHAEKDRSDKTNRNPHLNKKGLKRAKKWSEVFTNIDFDLIYSTDYHRTRETAMPTVQANKISLDLYDPRSINYEDFLSDTQGKTVLIVGHSNTTPLFTNKLLGDDKYDQIDDNNNANLYIVTIIYDTKTSTLLVID